MELNTVNVIEYVQEDITSITAYDNNDEGKEEAKEKFQLLVREHGNKVTDDEMTRFIKDGYYEQGSCQIFLMNSTSTN